MDDERDLDPGLLARTAAYFSRRPEFLGYWLDVYRETEDLEPPALARALGCDVPTLHRLAVCLRPRPERLAEGVTLLASRFGVDRDRLADLLLDAETYAARSARAVTGGPQDAAAAPVLPQPGFAAARDREADAVHEPEEQYGEPEGEDA